MSKQMLNTAPPTPETIVVNDAAAQVLCDGGGGALGHPAVYYSFDGQDSVDCLYCDRHFVKSRMAGRPAAV